LPTLDSGCASSSGRCPAHSLTCPANPATTSACAPPVPLLPELIQVLACDTDLWRDTV
jgi:hypothetical protein